MTETIPHQPIDRETQAFFEEIHSQNPQRIRAQLDKLIATTNPDNPNETQGFQAYALLLTLDKPSKETNASPTQPDRDQLTHIVNLVRNKKGALYHTIIALNNLRQEVIRHVANPHPKLPSYYYAAPDTSTPYSQLILELGINRVAQDFAPDHPDIRLYLAHTDRQHPAIFLDRSQTTPN